jgi:hypothetical protein
MSGSAEVERTMWQEFAARVSALNPSNATRLLALAASIADISANLIVVNDEDALLMVRADVPGWVRG